MEQTKINQKNMSWETLSYWMLWITGVAATVTFIIGLASLFIGHKASEEKDKKIAEMQKRINDRRLSINEQTALTDLLKERPKGKIEVRCLINAPEPRNFALDFVKVFTDSGWDVSLLDRLMVTPPPTGLSLKIFRADPLPTEGAEVPISESTAAIIEAFQIANIDMEREVEQNMPNDGSVILLVGYKR